MLPSLGLTVGFAGKRIEPDLSYNPDFRAYWECNALGGLSYLHRDGWLARVNALLVKQFHPFRDSSPFTILDFIVGRELPNKRGLVTFEMRKLLNRQFHYEIEPLRALEFAPARQFMCRMSLYF